MKGIVLSDLLNEAKTEESPELKPIYLSQSLNVFGNWNPADRLGYASRQHVLLERRYFHNGDDLIWAQTGEACGTLYRGHWNDGVTE